MLTRKRKQELESTEEGKKLKTQVLEFDQHQIFADPTYDPTFKMLFGSIKHQNLTKHFINTFFNLEDLGKVADIEFLSQELDPNNPDDMKSTLDVRCKTNHGYEIVIEMQRQYKPYFIARMQYYMARLIAQQGIIGRASELHKTIVKIYMLVISKENLYKEHELPEDKTFEKTLYPTIFGTNELEAPQNLTYYKLYEIDKAQLLIDTKIKSNEPLTPKEQWLDFFYKCGTINKEPDYLTCPEILEAYRAMKKSTWENEQNSLAYQMARLDEAFELMEAEARGEEKGREEGKAEGIAKGREEGKAEGIAKGREEGKAEGKAEGEAEAKMKMLTQILQSIKQAITASSLTHDVLVKMFENFFTEAQISKIEESFTFDQNYPIDKLLVEVLDCVGKQPESITGLDHAA